MSLFKWSARAKAVPAPAEEPAAPPEEEEILAAAPDGALTESALVESNLVESALVELDLAESALAESALAESAPPEAPDVLEESAEAEELTPAPEAPAAPPKDDPAAIEAELLALVAALKPISSPEARPAWPSPPSETADAYLGPEDEAGAVVAPTPEPGTDEAELECLRRLILGREIDDLADLRRQLTNPEVRARALSRVITEAILLRTQADQKLDTVLKPTVERILRGSVRRNPAELADNLFPVMGPAIRRSISEGIRSMLQDFSRVLEKSFTLTGLKWRLTAMRTGRSFSEVAFLNNLEYQVEQIFFVHTQTGIPLLHLVNDGVHAKDASGDQVAAMFTALQHFVTDSFAEGELNDLNFGDAQICVVRGPETYLACVVRGQPPAGLRTSMQAALELLVIELAEELDSFNGDLAPFQKSRHLLDGLLVSRLKDENKKLSPAAFLLPVLLAVVILGPLTYLGYGLRQTHLQAQAEAELEQQIYERAVAPGLSPVHVAREADNIWEITFLKDEMAENPGKILAALGLPADQVRITYLPYLSQDSDIVELRVDQTLAGRPKTLRHQFDWTTNTLTLSGRAPLGWVLTAHDSLRSLPGLRAVLIEGLVDPETEVTIDLGRDRILRLTGQVSLGWREAVKEKVQNMSGIGGLDLSLLKDDADSRAIKLLLNRVNSVAIFFPLNQDRPIEADRPRLLQAVDDLVALEKLARPMGLTVSLTIYGYTDISGRVTRNYELSQARARALAALLYERGSTISLTTFGLGPDPAALAQEDDRKSRTEKKEAAQASRRIELKARLDRARLTLNLQ